MLVHVNLRWNRKSRTGSGFSEGVSTGLKGASASSGCGGGTHWEAEGVEIRTSWNPGRARLLLSWLSTKV